MLNAAGNEKTVGLPFTVLVVKSVNSALKRINMNFLKRCFATRDDILYGHAIADTHTHTLAHLISLLKRFSEFRFT